MSYDILFSHKSANQLRDLIAFLRRKWNDKVVTNLLDELEECLHHISQKPSLYPVFYHRMNLRKCVIRRRTIILYQVMPRKNQIRVVYVGDTRKDPKKIKP